MTDAGAIFIFVLSKKDSRESKSIELNKLKKKKNEDINSCVYALIQLSGHSPKTVLQWKLWCFRLDFGHYHKTLFLADL